MAVDPRDDADPLSSHPKACKLVASRLCLSFLLKHVGFSFCLWRACVDVELYVEEAVFVYPSYDDCPTP